MRISDWSSDVCSSDLVSFSLERGRILGLVGESGSGKSVTGFSIIGLLDRPGRITGGQILFDGTDLAKLSGEKMRRFCGRRIATAFQDPMMNRDSVLTVGHRLHMAVGGIEPVTTTTWRQTTRIVLTRYP